MSTTLRYTLIALIVVILGALGLWYFFIEAKKDSIERADTLRGFNEGEAPLGNAIGSTYENVVSTIGSLVSGKKENDHASRLLEVNKTPVAGAGFVLSGKSATSTRLRFVERSTGNILEFDLGSKSLSRLTNQLIPKTVEAILSRSGTVLMRGVDEDENITSVVATLATSSAGGSLALKKTELPKNIRSVTFSEDGKEIFYLTRDGGRGRGIRALSDGSRATEVFSSNIVGWRSTLLPNGSILLAQLSADSIPGNAYILDKKGSLQKALGSIPGLTVLASENGALLYGKSEGTLSLYGKPAGSTSAALLPIKTTAEKCVWTRDSSIAYCAVPHAPVASGYLDLSRRGEAHSKDSWWKIDISAATAEEVYAGAELDVENPVIDDTGEYIAFMNAADKSLWLLRIDE